jgi:hypothetical protein
VSVVKQTFSLYCLIITLKNLINMVGDYDDRVEQIIRLTEDLFLEKRKVVMTVRVYNRGIANPEISKRCLYVKRRNVDSSEFST